MGGRKGGEGSDGGQGKHQSSGHKIFSRSCTLHFSNFLRDGLGTGGFGAVVTLGARPAPSPRLSFELYTNQRK